MAFSIETYEPGHLEGMSDLYNAETAFEGHIAPLTPERFAELVAAKSYFDAAGLLAAVEGGEVIGWVHACVAPGSEPRHDPAQPAAQIRMLIFPRERLDVGRALVAEATSWLTRSGQKVLLAMHAQEGYPFYRGLWLGGEPMGAAMLPHVQIAFEVNGYRNTQESVFMVGEMPSEPAEASTGVRIELANAPAEMAHGPMRESWVGFEPMATQALVGGENVGGISWVVLPHVAERLGAPVMNIWGLGVAEQHRRKGIAAALIRHAMARGYAAGARFGSVGTQLWNTPAHASYAKLGFVPHCVVIGRTLDLSAGGDR